MYLDPGFGSLVIQVIVAGIAAVSVVFFSMKARIKGWFSKKDNKIEKQSA
jgi:hypothetical protein